MKSETLLASIVMALPLLVGCTDSEQALRQVQKNLEQVLRTELRNGGVLMQRAGDHLTIILTERLLFDAGSQG